MESDPSPAVVAAAVETSSGDPPKHLGTAVGESSRLMTPDIATTTAPGADLPSAEPTVNSEISAFSEAPQQCDAVPPDDDPSAALRESIIQEAKGHVAKELPTSLAVLSDLLRLVTEATDEWKEARRSWEARVEEMQLLTENPKSLSDAETVKLVVLAALPDLRTHELLPYLSPCDFAMLKAVFGYIQSYRRDWGEATRHSPPVRNPLIDALEQMAPQVFAPPYSDLADLGRKFVEAFETGRKIVDAFRLKVVDAIGQAEAAEDSKVPEFSPWIEAPHMLDLMRRNGIKGKADRTVSRKKNHWGATFQPNTNFQKFRFELSKLRKIGIVYPPEWDSPAT